MKRQYFGTDGVRGVANGPLLTPQFVLSLGQAAARVLPAAENGFVLIGCDSRVSGPMLEAALRAGIQSAGRDTASLGIVPTPAVSYLTARSKADFGVVISASHNPVPDNGIKFFDGSGHKLSEETEAAIEHELLSILAGETRTVPTGTGIGGDIDAAHLMADYRAHLHAAVGQPLFGLRIVCDAAWGAAAPWAEAVLRATGAEVHIINGRACGALINLDCGSTHPETLQQQVVERGADLGLALDGDADRVIAVDEKGRLVDGDYILYILASQLLRENPAAAQTVVGTVMSNLGVEKAFERLGINFVRAGVGDRYVWEQMKAHDAHLGGEQSGHIINRRWGTTGDGMLNGLQLAAALKESGQPLSQLAAGLRMYPQKLINVEVCDKQAAMASQTLAAALRAAEADLRQQGRIVLRPSGTQPVIRVMVEAEEEAMAVSVAERIAEVIRAIAQQ